MEASAKGSAKTVWENLTNEAHLVIPENIKPCAVPTSNIQHPTSNIQHPMVRLLRRKGILAGRVDDDSALLRFVGQSGYLQRRCELIHRTPSGQTATSSH